MTDIDRRKFLLGGGAVVATAAVAPVLPAAEPFVYTEEVIDFALGYEISYVPIRETLFPGLFAVWNDYEKIPRQWDSIFREHKA